MYQYPTAILASVEAESKDSPIFIEVSALPDH